jgi:Ni/Co efflux regulator RcnB
MNKISGWTGRVLSVLITVTMAASPVLADKPGGQGKGKGHENREGVEHHQNEAPDDDRGKRDRVGLSPREGVYFVDQRRVFVREYYGDQFRRGFCPPGLAKKHNGCMPPGQVKKWQIGRSLPRDVTFYDLPPALVVQIGAPPAGHRYVRVAADILLISVGTGMVIDAIQDLGRV